ncbi:MAG: sulfur carrier protein ThiS adenylyltransferase ThiF [Planctomycetota bacterium]|jgi:sulfur carrier protein ThiS adenylyltransferase
MTSIKEKLSKATVGIAGLGGLGSTVAVALARAGIGRLIIADFDTVEAKNLTRQQYFTDQIGESKVDCTIENLSRINPNVQVKGHREKLDADNVPRIFADADVIAECFDEAEAKQMIVEAVLSKMDKQIVVSVSGLAGYGNSNAIRTRRISLILVGDDESGIDSHGVLLAPRVGIAACHQANAIVEVIVNEIDDERGLLRSL